MPAAQYTGGPQNLPGGYDGSVGTIPGGYPFTTQIEDVTARNRALTCELQNGRAAMLGTFGAMCHSCVDSCDHHFFYPITPTKRGRSKNQEERLARCPAGTTSTVARRRRCTVTPPT